LGNAPPQPKAPSGVPVAVPAVLGLVLQLRWTRAALGLTQAQAAKRAGVSQQQIARLEHPDANPTIEMLARVAQGFGRALSVEIKPQTSVQRLVVSAGRPRRTKASKARKARKARKASPRQTA